MFSANQRNPELHEIPIVGDPEAYEDRQDFIRCQPQAFQADTSRDYDLYNFDTHRKLVQTEFVSNDGST